MLEFIRVFLRENNTHSHLSIKNNVKSLFLLMFLALCAKMEKKGGKVGRRVVVREVESENRRNTHNQNFQRGPKKWGRVCTKWHDVNDYIYI